MSYLMVVFLMWNDLLLGGIPQGGQKLADDVEADSQGEDNFDLLFEEAEKLDTEDIVEMKEAIRIYIKIINKAKGTSHALKAYKLMAMVYYSSNLTNRLELAARTLEDSLHPTENISNIVQYCDLADIYNELKNDELSLKYHWSLLKAYKELQANPDREKIIQSILGADENAKFLLDFQEEPLDSFVVLLEKTLAKNDYKSIAFILDVIAPMLGEKEKLSQEEYKIIHSTTKYLLEELEGSVTKDDYEKTQLILTAFSTIALATNGNRDFVLENTEDKIQPEEEPDVIVPNIKTYFEKVSKISDSLSKKAISQKNYTRAELILSASVAFSPRKCLELMNIYYDKKEFEKVIAFYDVISNKITLLHTFPLGGPEEVEIDSEDYYRLAFSAKLQIHTMIAREIMKLQKSNTQTNLEMIKKLEERRKVSYEKMLNFNLKKGGYDGELFLASMHLFLGNMKEALSAYERFIHLPEDNARFGNAMEVNRNFSRKMIYLLTARRDPIDPDVEEEENTEYDVLIERQMIELVKASKKNGLQFNFDQESTHITKHVVIKGHAGRFIIFDIYKAKILAVLSADTISVGFDRIELPKQPKNGRTYRIIFESTKPSVIENISGLYYIINKAPKEYYKMLNAITFSAEKPKYFAGYYSGSNRGISIYSNACPFSDTIMHEMAHLWDDVNPGKLKLFYSISWKDQSTRLNEDEREFLGSCADPKNYYYIKPKEKSIILPKYIICNDRKLRPYGMLSQFEDFATAVEDYFSNGDYFRSNAIKYLSSLEKSENFENAGMVVKYLFLRYMTPFEGNEYGNQQDSPQISLSEVHSKLEKWSEPEAKRLLLILQTIQASKEYYKFSGPELRKTIRNQMNKGIFTLAKEYLSHKHKDYQSKEFDLGKEANDKQLTAAEVKQLLDKWLTDHPRTVDTKTVKTITTISETYKLK